MGAATPGVGTIKAGLPSSRRALLLLSAAVVVIAGLALFAVLIKFVLPEGTIPGDKTLTRQFILDNENNIPTWYSSALFLVGAALASVLASFDSDRRRGWMGLGIIFLLLSIDETASFHESANSTLRQAWDLHGVLRFAWVIPASAALMAFLAGYARFVLALPSDSRRRLIGAGVVYVTGALGGDLVGGWYWDTYGGDTVGYGLITTVEELLEMIGLVLLVYALMTHAELFRPQLVGEPGGHPPPRSNGA